MIVNRFVPARNLRCPLWLEKLCTPANWTLCKQATQWETRLQELHMQVLDVCVT